MFAIKPRIEVGIRVSLIVGILLNALSPVTASAGSAGESQTTSTTLSTSNDVASSLTLGARHVPIKEDVPVLSEQIAEQAQQNQEEKPVKFEVWAEPAIYTPGHPINLYWKVQNLKSEDLADAEVVIHAPEGFTSAEPKATYTSDGLVTVPLKNKKDISSWIVEADAELPIYFDLDLLVNDDLITSETVMVDQAHFSVEKNKGGMIRSLNGKVEVEVPASAMDESLDFDVRYPAPHTQPGVSLTWNPVEILAVGKTSQKNVDKFKSPIKITVKYDEQQIFDWEENALTLYYYDPGLLEWFPIETTVDTENNTLTAYSDHLTVFDYKANNWQSQSLPTVDSFKVSDFTGAGTYTINFWTPPGQGGLQPSLALTYNSQMIDESSAFSQPSWVGMGWDLGTGAINRNMHGTDSDTSDDTFLISAGGVSGLLLPISVNGNVTTYNTADQSFMKVQFNSSTNKWTAWGTYGTQYEFASIARISTTDSDGCATSSQLNLVWRWSLTKITDTHGNQLTYNYTVEQKNPGGGCYNEIAVYPLSISYSNGKYSILFDTETRNDYQTSWTTKDSKTLYGTKRLMQIRVQNNGTTVRRYAFSYAPDTETTNIIYPNFLWSHDNAKTLTLVGVQEFANDSSSPALPAVTFTYADQMHVTNVNNGQGGQVQLTYERWTYFDDINKDLRSLRTIFGYHECRAGYGASDTQWALVGSVGTVRCDPVTYLQVGNTAHQHSVAERPIPEHMVKPGGRYRYFIKGRTFDETSTAPVYGFRDTGTDQMVVVTSAVEFDHIAPHETDERSLEMPATYNPSKTKLRLECQNCFFSDFEFILFPLMYRVLSRTITIQPTGNTSTYTYNYDNASPNSKDNSAAANVPGATLYTKVLREFRGHAMTQVSNPEGLTTVNWFYQTDSLKGRAYDTLVLKRDEYVDLKSAVADWANTGGTLAFDGKYQIDFDWGAKLTNTDSNWDVSFGRNTATLTSGEVAVAHVRLTEEDGVTENNAQGEVGLVENGGQFFGITFGSNTATASNGVTLLGSGNFKKDEWYAVMFFLDANHGSRIRIWQLDDPANSGETVVSGVGGGDWKIRTRVNDGTIWVDSYFEGTPYTETITRYNTTVHYDVTAVNTLIPSSTVFQDLQVVWNTVPAVENRNYNGDARFVGTKQEFTYDTPANYGHLLTQMEYAGDNGTWTLYRGSKTQYAAPNTTAYIVSLPGRQVTLDCTGGSCDFTNESGKVSEVISFYDNNTSYTSSPVKGELTRQRTWVQGDDYSQTSFTYYPNGNLKDQIAFTGYATATQTNDPTGAQPTTTSYDTAGYDTYPVSVTNALGHSTQTGYDFALGLPTSLTDPNGAVTFATYDGFGRMETITAPGDGAPATLQITYHDARIPFQIDLKQLVDARDNTFIRLSRFYDGAGRQIQTQTVGAVVNGEQKNVVIDYQYDNLGRLVDQSIPHQIPYDVAPIFVAQDFTQSTITTYDVLGRTLSVMQPNGNVISYEYGDLTTKVTDPKGFITATTMDVWGRPTFVDAPEGPDVAYEYDILDRLETVLRGGQMTKINYDAAGHKLDMTDPDMGFWQYRYDAVGNLKLQTDNRGCALSLDYDILNRLMTKTSSGVGCNQQVDITYGYDDVTNGNKGIGRRTSMSDSSGSTSWIYDERGRLTQENKTITDASPFITAWTYNSADLPVTMTYPDGEVVTYGYNSDGSLNTITSNLGDIYLAGTQYDEAGRITSMDYGAGILRKTFNYFPWNTAIQGGLPNTAVTTRLGDSATLQSFAYTYDKNANVETIIDHLAGPQTQAFGYDSLNRLTSATVTGGMDGLYSESYEYDPNSGNLSMKGGLAYSYNDPSHAHAVTNAGSNTYSYDPNGNMVQRSVNGQSFNLAYDAENRLISVSTGGTGKDSFLIFLPFIELDLPKPTPTPTATVPPTFSNATFVYDGDGKRVKSVITTNLGTTTTYFVGDHYEVANGVVTKYYFAGSQRIAMRTDSTLNYLLGDHLGSTSLTTDATGIVISELRYKAWGEERFASGSTPTQYTYTGQYSYAADFGLMYYGARWYDPALGRFGQADTISPEPVNPQGLDRYAYVFNNPLLYTDPSGHWPEWYDRVMGALNQYFEDITLGLFPGDPDDVAVPAFQEGRQIGRVVSTAQAAAEGAHGIIMIGTGITAAPPTAAAGAACTVGTGGICALPAGGVILVEGGVVLVGAGEVAHGAAVLAYAAENPVETPSSQSNANTSRPSRFRKQTIQDAWDNAEQGPTEGRLCPTCGRGVRVEPGQGPRDWDLDHQPPWSQRDLTGMNRQQILDEFNRGTRLECPFCNRGRGARPIE